jgi:hypothetical protein
MRLLLTNDDVKALLGAYLMHDYVPFSSALKLPLDSHDRRITEAVRNRLLRAREDRASRGKCDDINTEISNDEAHLLLRILDSVLKECINDDEELELHVGTRQTVEGLVSKLRS